jgi:hypothetical protein
MRYRLPDLVLLLYAALQLHTVSGSAGKISLLCRQPAFGHFSLLFSLSSRY